MTTPIIRLHRGSIRPLTGRRIVVLCAVTALTAIGLSAVPAASSATPSGNCASASTASRAGKFGGIAHPVGSTGACKSIKEAPYGGTPPLINHGGPVMAVPAVGSTVVVTPIYWAPSGYSFPSSYKSVINTYLANIAADSGKSTNVFSENTQYPGNNGNITYNIVKTAAITDTTAYPSAGCVVNGGPIYADGSGYSTCLDDAQLEAEITNVLTANGFTSDFGHMYPLFTPKGVESCFLPGNPSNQACTINGTASAAFCAYHSYFGASGTPSVYANMPFPVYQSATGFSCTNENLGGGIQSPNGNVDADVEVSPLSHEMSEAITDPELNAWYDSHGNENGDDCAYIYGALSGAPGVHYNQVVNGGHYLTQEEFSNADFVPNVSGCKQGTATAVLPTVTMVAPAAGPTSGGTKVTITGTGFSGATAVKFGSVAGTSVTVVSGTKITVKSPAESAGVVDVRVTAPGGKSAVVTADHFRYQNAPTVTSVSPASGPVAGGQTVTIKGTNFTAATVVKFGSATSTFTVVSATKITATSPAQSAGLVDVRVTTSSGKSAVSAADQYTYS